MSISTKQARIAEKARVDPGRKLTSLNGNLDLAWMTEAFRRTRKSGAPGIDNQTGKTYERNLMENLTDLLNRAKSGRYKAPPVRRAYIPKDGKEMRPLGIPTFEDKVLQRAIAMLLEPIYECDFLDCSYGFRPGRSAHQALARIWKTTMQWQRCWILDVDIRRFFDTLDHAKLREILGQRIQDGVVCRLIHKWLKAGVMEDGQIEYPDAGAPQGGVISPLLSNIYLHQVLDTWFYTDVVPRLARGACLVRFADDFVIIFQDRIDAQRVLNVLPKRFAKYGLTIHPDKTKLLYFGPPSDDEENPQSFDFLGFTHYWGTSRRGKPIVQRKTSRKKRTKSLKLLGEWCRKNLHELVNWQHRKLCEKLLGHYAYYGISGNYRSLSSFKKCVERLWRKWLDRRSRRRDMKWETFKKLLERHPLPTPRILHPDV